MTGSEDRQTFAAMLGDLPEPHHPVGAGAFVPLDPDGSAMPAPQQLTIKQARPWIKRNNVPLGVWPCAPAIEWVPAAEREDFAARLRRMEGGDCDPGGDMLLFALPRHRHALVLRQP